jgi:hypothetical protein
VFEQGREVVVKISITTFITLAVKEQARTVSKLFYLTVKMKV